MLPLLEQKREAIAELCRRFGVQKLEVFGSATSGRFNPLRSDVDLLVEFDRDSGIGPADQYFGLLFALEELFGRKVDLVCIGAMRNPYFIATVNANRQPLYAA